MPKVTQQSNVQLKLSSLALLLLSLYLHTIAFQNKGIKVRNKGESLLGLDNANVYDSGGILRGTGGIKATARDELVLPPDITERLLSPVGNNIVRDRMDDLREMLGLKPESGTINNSSIGTQNNGDTYTMNGVTLTEGAARTTTVYDLAQMARSLGAYQRS